MMDYEYESDNRRSAFSSDAYLKEQNARTLRKRYDALEEASRSNALPSTLATPKLEAFIDEMALQTVLPRSIVLCAALNQLALTAQGAYRLQLDINRSPVPLSLWFLVEMKSGEGKSPLADYMQRLVEPVFGEAQLRFEKAMTKYSAKYSVWVNIKSGLESALRKAVKKGESVQSIAHSLEVHMADEPRRPREFARNLSDVTKSGLCVTASNALPSLGIHAAEGGVALQCIDANFMYVANVFWRGEDYDYRRVNQVSAKFKDVFLSIMLCAQPGVIAKFLDQNGSLAWETGFLARFLVCRSGGESETNIESRDVSSSRGDGSQGAYYQEVVRKIFNDQIMDDWTGLKPPKLLKLGEGAQIRYEEFREYLKGEQREGSRFERIQEFCTKLPEMVGRIAALMHLYEGGVDSDEAISIGTMNIAIEIGLYFASVYAPYFTSRFGYSEEEMDEILLWKWLCKKSIQEGVTEISVRGILQRGPRCVRTKTRRDRALQTFLDRRWISKKMSMDGSTEVVLLSGRGTDNMLA